MASEAERVAHGNRYLLVYRMIWCVVQIAVRIWIMEIEGWWDGGVAYRHDADGRLQGASGPEEMSCHGFGRADGYPVCIIPQSQLDGFSFLTVIQWCGSTMGI